MTNFVTSSRLVDTLVSTGVTHIVYLPDSEHSRTYDLIKDSPALNLVRVSREAEAIAIAIGLLVGGKRPLVMIQNTGFLESGDSVRGFLRASIRFGLVIVVGYRGWREDGQFVDSAAIYTEPILQAWNLPYRILKGDADLQEIGLSYQRAEATNESEVLLLLEDENFVAQQSAQ